MVSADYYFSKIRTPLITYKFAIQIERPDK